jgi:hypothetical protein
MKRLMLLSAVFSFAIAATAVADPRWRLIVPVEIENVPAAITRALIECRIASTPTFDATRTIGDASTHIAIEGGRYSGRVGMDIFPRGAPVGVDATVDGRSYSCSINLEYRCTRADGAGEGWCQSGAGGSAPGASDSVARLFETDPARPPTGRIEGQIDRAGATTLPAYRG